MRFSDHFGIMRAESEGWFDPVLSIDIKLFIDPFLVYADEFGHFRGSHNEIIGFFNSIFRLIARAEGECESVLFRKALGSLKFPEVEEVCLGYTAAGTKGSGAGGHSARLIAAAIWEAIRAGMVQITHFEEVAILREGVGADRISDITASLLRNRLAMYTHDVCAAHGIATDAIRYHRGVYDRDSERWVPIDARLPRNPYNAKPILLVPERYLNLLPTINAQDFWDYCYINENETLRTEFSHDITRNVSKSDIIALARRRKDLRERYLQQVEGRRAQPYDLQRDRRGLVRWYDASKTYCGQNPLQVSIASEEDFVEAIDRMVRAFKHFVEENGGWRLLWNDNSTPKREEASQLLFLGIVKHYCQANNIDISREAEVGRGPVDFKVSSGYCLRELLEVKLAKNSRFWHGLRKQLPTYQQAEGVRRGYFIVIAYSDKDLERLKDIYAVVDEVNTATGCQVVAIVVDASPEKPSASRV